VLKKKKNLFSIAFMYGRHEHYLEALTNALFIPTIVIAFANYFDVNPIKNSQEIVLSLLTICFTIHMLARFCHRREKKFHTLARKKYKK